MRSTRGKSVSMNLRASSERVINASRTCLICIPAVLAVKSVRFSLESALPSLLRGRQTELKAPVRALKACSRAWIIAAHGTLCPGL